MARPTSTDDALDLVVRVPRAALTVIEPAVLVSQKSSAAVLGMPPSNFLADLPGFVRDGGCVIRRGKLRLVYVDRFVEWLSARSRASAATVSSADDENDQGDVYAAELGLRAVASGGRRAR